MRTPNLFNMKHGGWAANKTNSYAFSSNDSYEIMVLSRSGKFNFGMFGQTKADSKPSWFTMSGSCTPFDE